MEAENKGEITEATTLATFLRCGLHRVEESGDSRCFFPASGNYNGSSVNNRGSNGNYWTRSFNSSSNAWKLNFNSGNQNTNTNNRNNGFSVRGVRCS